MTLSLDLDAGGRSTAGALPIPSTPYAWTAVDLPDKSSVLRCLDSMELGAIDAALRSAPRQDPALGDEGGFRGQALLDLTAELRHRLVEGPGIAVLSGLDPERYAQDQLKRLFWGLGAHLGRGVVQSFAADQVRVVEDRPASPSRGWADRRVALRPHTDFHDILALMCVNQADRGGQNQFVSARAVFEHLQRERPRSLRTLMAGWRNLRPGTSAPFPDATPIFSCTEGVLSCFLNRAYYSPGEGQEWQELQDAIEHLIEIAERPALQLRFLLMPGEMVFWQNFAVMHGRSGFVDGQAAKRRYLRLWLHAVPRRPLDERVRALTDALDAYNLVGGLGLDEGGQLDSRRL